MSEIWDIVDENGIPKGRTHLRGVPMTKGDYHPSVTVWIVNQKGEILVSRRAEGKRAAGMWEAAGGCTLSGETQLDAAIREIREELGITLDPGRGEVYKNYTAPTQETTAGHISPCGSSGRNSHRTTSPCSPRKPMPPSGWTKTRSSE